MRFAGMRRSPLQLLISTPGQTTPRTTTAAAAFSSVDGQSSFLDPRLGRTEWQRRRRRRHPPLQGQCATFSLAPTPRFTNGSVRAKSSTSVVPTSPVMAKAGGDVSSPQTHARGPEPSPTGLPRLPFCFDTGIALFAKRPPRPFPPPFLSPPSGSFSDPLSTHDRSRDRRTAYVDGQLIRGLTNGDDAVFASEYFICANDGVGAWSTRPRGHAGQITHPFSCSITKLTSQHWYTDFGHG